MFMKAIRAMGLVLALLASGCHNGPSAPLAISLTDGSGLSPTDDIKGLDAAIDADGTVHVVWQELLGEYSDSRGSRLVYRRGSGTPLHWGPRVLLAAGRSETENPQIVATRRGVHVFAGGQLHHWWLPVNAPIRDQGNLLGDDGPQADRFDAVATRDGVLIVFAKPAQSRREIYAIGWTPTGPRAPVLIAAYAHSYDARVQLLRVNDRWMAFWADNTLVDYLDPTDGRMATTGHSDVRMAESLDEGANWGPMARNAVSSKSDIVGIAADSIAGAPAAFFASDGLYESSLRAGAWTSPLRIAGYDAGFFSGSTETSAVAATTCNGHTALAWVDARYRRSDRRPWNPLGGFPWGDDPDWDNNDLFVATDAPQSASAAAALVPLRLTVDPSMTRDIALVAREGRLLVFRSGRARVRKAPYDAGAPPELTQSSISCN